VTHVNTKYQPLGLPSWVKEEGANCRLHPLIYTRLEFNLAQDMGKHQGSVGERKRKPPLTTACTISEGTASRLVRLIPLAFKPSNEKSVLQGVALSRHAGERAMTLKFSQFCEVSGHSPAGGSGKHYPFGSPVFR
jgi:hypothetical protein